MGQAVASLFASAGLIPAGVVRWDVSVPTKGPGVYVVALTDNPSRTNATVPDAPIGEMATERLLGACPELRLDGIRPTAQQLRNRIAACWLPTETVLYMGKASISVHKRVKQYYDTPLGAKRPHAGGWFLKTLANFDELFVHCASTDKPEVAERVMLDAFIAAVSLPVRERLHDPTLPLPFANLQLPGGRRKRHGITGATGCV